MYIARVKALKFEDSIKVGSVRTLFYVLDTDDCIVESYTMNDCMKLCNRINLRGVVGNSPIVVNQRVTFKKLLNDRIEVKDSKIYVDGAVKLSFIRKSLEEGVFFDAKNLVLCTMKGNLTPNPPEVSFVWAEKLGTMGYRLVLSVDGLYFYNLHDSTSYRWHVYLFLDNNGCINIERVECKSSVPFEWELNKTGMSNGLRARLGMKGMV